MAEPWRVGDEEDRWAGYFYPVTDAQPDRVLRNVLGIRDATLLARVEEVLSTNAATVYRTRPEPATFGWDHLAAIHRRLFGEVYPWAGQARTTGMVKGRAAFGPPEQGPATIEDLGAVLSGRDYLRGLGRADFLAGLSVTYTVLNQAHPFREGNGRAQRLYLDDLARGAGFVLDWSQVRGEANDEATDRARRGDLTMQNQMLDRILTRPAAPVWSAQAAAALRAVDSQLGSSHSAEPGPLGRPRRPPAPPPPAPRR